MEKIILEWETTKQLNGYVFKQNYTIIHRVQKINCWWAGHLARRDNSRWPQRLNDWKPIHIKGIHDGPLQDGRGLDKGFSGEKSLRISGEFLYSAVGRQVLMYTHTRIPYILYLLYFITINILFIYVYYINT